MEFTLNNTKNLPDFLTDKIVLLKQVIGDITDENGTLVPGSPDFVIDVLNLRVIAETNGVLTGMIMPEKYSDRKRSRGLLVFKREHIEKVLT